MSQVFRSVSNTDLSQDSPNRDYNRTRIVDASSILILLLICNSWLICNRTTQEDKLRALLIEKSGCDQWERRSDGWICVSCDASFRGG